jgi:predicted GTPase
MLNFLEFKILEAEQNPKISQLEDQIKNKLSKISDLKKEAKAGKSGNEAKVSSLSAQAKAYSEISSLMNNLVGELRKVQNDKESSTNIY